MYITLFINFVGQPDRWRAVHDKAPTPASQVPHPQPRRLRSAHKAGSNVRKDHGKNTEITICTYMYIYIFVSELCSMIIKHLGGGHKPNIYIYIYIYIYTYIYIYMCIYIYIYIYIFFLFMAESHWWCVPVYVRGSFS